MTTRAKRSAKSSGIEALVAGDGDVMKALMQEALQEFLEAEMREALGAASGERTASCRCMSSGRRSGRRGSGAGAVRSKLTQVAPRAATTGALYPVAACVAVGPAVQRVAADETQQ